MRNATKNLIALSAAGLASIAGLTTTVTSASAGAPATYHLVGQPTVVEKNTTTTMYAPLVVSGDHAQPTVVSLAIIPMGEHPATAADFAQPLAFQAVVPAHVQGVQIPVKVKGDTTHEEKETFRLQITGLSQPGNVGAPIIATINDDDFPLQQAPVDPQVPDDKAPLPQDDPDQPQDKAPLPQGDDTPDEPKADAPADADEDEAAEAPTTTVDEADDAIDTKKLPVAETSATIVEHDPRDDRTEIAAASETEATTVSEDEAGFPMALALGLGAGAAALGGVIIARRRRDDDATA